MIVVLVLVFFSVIFTESGGRLFMGGQEFFWGSQRGTTFFSGSKRGQEFFESDKCSCF